MLGGIEDTLGILESGKETALVAVKDQNHHILDYAKRLEWQSTIWAWFAKYLQDDPSWWDALYPPKSL